MIFRVRKTRFKKSNSIKAFSLVEVVVALGIVGMIITLFFNILVNVIDASLKSSARSLVREELSTATNLLSRDLRNADTIIQCGDPDNETICEMITGGQLIRWERCGDNAQNLDRICRYVVENGTETLDYEISDSVNIEDMTFEVGYSQSSDTSKQNILLTLSASHSNQRLEVNNVIRQVSVSTRNYDIPTAFVPDEPPPPSPCNAPGAETKTVTIPITIQRNTTQGCPWGVGDNYTQRDEYVQARADHEINIPLSNYTTKGNVCNVQFTFPTQTIFYDDDWILRLNDRIILISHNRYYNRFRDEGLLKVYDWRRIRGVDNRLDGETVKGVCAGGILSGTAQCNVPTTETQGQFRLNIDDDRSTELGAYINSITDPKMIVTITGDDNDTDCKLYNNFTFNMVLKVLK